VLIDSHDFLCKKLLNKFTLPSGVLRETFSNLKRADLIIQNNKDRELRIIPQLEAYGKDISVLRYKTEYFIDNKNSILQNYKYDALLFSGIANDESFVNMVKQSGINVSEVIQYSDHYIYNEADITLLVKKYREGKIFITTEKDFIKLRRFEEFVNKYPVYFLKLGIEIILNSNVLYKKLDEIIK
ncbi:MAG: tetraacyldisaccharide 4'-kinase, partial [bacterium]